ncbi:hypothetical protein D9M69_633360 [compost metagenome]
MNGTSALDSLKWLITFTSSIPANSSSVVFIKGLLTSCPALLIRISTVPRDFSTKSSSRAIGSFARSKLTGIRVQSGLSPFAISKSLFSFSELRETATTLCSGFLINSNTISKPRPLPAPVTTIFIFYTPSEQITCNPSAINFVYSFLFSFRKTR